MIELLGWIGLVISFALMIYHQYMHSNYEKTYEYISKRYASKVNNIKFPSKDDHLRDAKKFSYYTVFLACILIIMSFLSQQYAADY